MSSRKKNFITKRKKNFGKEFKTMFNIGVSSKALFELSPNALKLYMMFVINGKKTEPSIARFAKMTKMSPRTISRYYEELKEKNFLKITPIGINRYKYEFDPYGNIDIPYRKKVTEEVTEETKVEYVEKEIEEAVIEEKIETEKDFTYLQKAQTIQEYEDFAILENYYWTLDTDTQTSIVSILRKRYEKEPNNRDAIEWFLNKIT